MNALKQTIDLLGVTMKELRGKCRERRIADARTLVAAALPIAQHQVAELLGCTRQAVSKMRRRHKALLTCDAAYRAKWEQIKSLNQ